MSEKRTISLRLGELTPSHASGGAIHTRLSCRRIMAVGRPMRGRFSGPACRRFPCGAERVHGVRCAGSSKSSASRPRVSADIRAPRYGEAVRAASRQFHERAFLLHVFPRVFAAVFHQQQDGLAKAFQTFLPCAPLAIGLGHLRAKGHEPFAITLNFCCQRHVHGGNIARCLAAAQAGVCTA